MGTMIEFPSNGQNASGYLAEPEEANGKGVVVIQEWWGLVPHIKDVCDRFAQKGFMALAPDLYHGATTKEPDEAAKAMMAMKMDVAAKDMSGAVDELIRRTGKKSVGVTGFCMGGGLALVLAAKRGDAVSAVVPWYGLIPWPEAKPDYSKMTAKVLGHYAELDDFASKEAVEALGEELKASGIEANLKIYPRSQHAFFNDTRPEVYDPEASKVAFDETIEFFNREIS